MTKALRQIGLVVLVVLATSGVWQAAAQVEVKKERPKWEYYVSPNPTDSLISKMGEDGWELVAATSSDRIQTVYFKRQK